METVRTVSSVDVIAASVLRRVRHISRHASVALENSSKAAVNVAWNAAREQPAAENNQKYKNNIIRADFFPSRRDLSVVIKDPEGYEDKKTESFFEWQNEFRFRELTTINPFLGKEYVWDWLFPSIQHRLISHSIMKSCFNHFQLSTFLIVFS